MLNLELESSFSEIVSLQSAHNDMSAKPCDICTMIMINYADLWLIHSHVFQSLNLQLLFVIWSCSSSIFLSCFSHRSCACSVLCVRQQEPAPELRILRSQFVIVLL
jgi:hypothetical protein